MPEYGIFAAALPLETDTGGKVVVMVDETTKEEYKIPADELKGESAPIVQTIAYAANVTMNVANGKNAKISLTGNITAFSFSGLVAGYTGVITITMAGSGNHTIGWGSAKVPIGGLALSGAVGELTSIHYFFDGVNVILFKVNYGAASVTPPADTTPPVLLGAVISVANEVWCTMSEGSVFTHLGFTILKNGSAWNPTGAAPLGGGVYKLLMPSPAAPGDTVTIAYNSSTGNTTDMASPANPLASFSAQSVTNNLGVNPVQLATPTVTVSPVSTSELSINWDNIASEDGYEIEVSSTGISNSYVAFETKAADVTSTAETGLSENTTRYYRVRALGNGTTTLNSAWGVGSGTTNTSGGGGGTGGTGGGGNTGDFPIP